jgi:hypothetical protein
MTERRVRCRLLLITILLAAPLASIGCGGGPTLEIEEATSLIQAQFPESEEIAIRTDSETGEPAISIDADGKAVASTRFNGNLVDFIFRQGEGEEPWVLEAVDFEGSFYLIDDLEQISATMELMAEMASAMELYRVANGTYPVGDGHEILHTLSPDFMPEETDYNDAWGQELSYESDGDDYTMISLGADGESGSRDDIILHSGDFVGPNREGQGQQ